LKCGTFTPRTPFGSEKWKNARPEVLQRTVLMSAIPFESDNCVEGNDKFKIIAYEMLELLVSQCKRIKAKHESTVIHPQVCNFVRVS
jgi:hypothetical protein